MKMAAKKTKPILSLEQKVEIIQKLDRGVKANRLASDYNVAESTISYIKKQKSEILAAVAESVHEVKKKSLHKPQHEEMEKQLWSCFSKSASQQKITNLKKMALISFFLQKVYVVT